MEVLKELLKEINKIDEDLDVLHWLWFRPIPYYFDFFILYPDALAWTTYSRNCILSL